MDSLREMHREIVRQFASLQQGDAAVSMEAQGLKYAVNYGLSVMEIKRIASKWEPDNDFALHLLSSDDRESRIAALILFKPDQLSNGEVLQVCSSIDTVELAEQAVRHLLVNLPAPFDLVETLCQSDSSFEKMTGYLLMARLFVSGRIEPEWADRCYRMTMENMMCAEMLTARSISRAVVSLAGYDQGKMDEISRLVQTNRQSNDKTLAWIAEEVITVLGLE
jgi:hypothetical protein